MVLENLGGQWKSSYDRTHPAAQRYIDNMGKSSSLGGGHNQNARADRGQPGNGYNYKDSINTKPGGQKLGAPISETYFPNPSTVSDSHVNAAFDRELVVADPKLGNYHLDSPLNHNNLDREFKIEFLNRLAATRASLERRSRGARTDGPKSSFSSGQAVSYSDTRSIDRRGAQGNLESQEALATLTKEADTDPKLAKEADKAMHMVAEVLGITVDEAIELYKAELKHLRNLYGDLDHYKDTLTEEEALNSPIFREAIKRGDIEFKQNIHPETGKVLVGKTLIQRIKPRVVKAKTLEQELAERRGVYDSRRNSYLARRKDGSDPINPSSLHGVQPKRYDPRA